MRTVLIVEDDAAVSVALNDFVRNLGFRTVVCADGESAIELAASEHPDLILLDVVLPRKDGVEVCQAVRQQGSVIPIIMITAKGQSEDRVRGLDVGADDYITKPFDLAELGARIRAVLRRTGDAIDGQQSCYDLGGSKIDLEGFWIDRGGQRYDLSARERDILALLLSRLGQVVSRHEILNDVWGADRFPSTRTVDNYIVSIRKKLESDPSVPRFLFNVRGAGYKLVDHRSEED